MDLALPKQPPAPLASAEHFLARTDVLLDWSQYERDDSQGESELGEPLPVHAVKIALLKQWYGLADAEAPFQILDRLSFRAFVGFLGDGSAADIRIVRELNDCTWSRHPDMIEAIESVEEQLRNLGYSVRRGSMNEPSLAPCTESGVEFQESTKATSLFRPGELGRMVEAVTAKAHADGVMPPASTVPTDVNAEVSADVSFDAPLAEPISKSGSEHVLAVLEWPWGQRTELTEHLNIGRDYQFSQLAKELTPYTHVSRKHAELLVYGDGVWVRDLGSRNGTFVNDEEVPKGQAYLIDSDSIIRFGPLLAVSLKLSA